MVTDIQTEAVETIVGQYQRMTEGAELVLRVSVDAANGVSRTLDDDEPQPLEAARDAACRALRNLGDREVSCPGEHPLAQAHEAAVDEIDRITRVHEGDRDPLDAGIFGPPWATAARAAKDAVLGALARDLITTDQCAALAHTWSTAVEPVDRVRLAVGDLGAATDRYDDLAKELAAQADMVERRRRERDDAIRRAREMGIPYRALCEVTGLSRARIDQIRRGANR